jgi:hypothetical protein
MFPYDQFQYILVWAKTQEEEKVVGVDAIGWYGAILFYQMIRTNSIIKYIDTASIVRKQVKKEERKHTIKLNKKTSFSFSSSSPKNHRKSRPRLF